MGPSPTSKNRVFSISDNMIGAAFINVSIFPMVEKAWYLYHWEEPLF